MSYYIYKICCDDLLEFIYVGSTKSFRQRKNHHKTAYYKGDTKKIYNTIRENGGWENWRMVILEELGEVSFTEARIKEEEHRVKLNANLNMQKCYTTEEEKKEIKKKWREDNKDYYKKYSQNNNETIKLRWKTWYNNNKEYVLNYQKNYNENNKQALAERCKKYIENNKQKLAEYSKEWRENNKQKIKEWKSKKITCECGCLITQSHINRHKKSNKHLELMKQ